MTKDQAMLIIDMHEIDSLMRDDEERELLEENNPELLEAYRALLKIAEITDAP